MLIAAYKVLMGESSSGLQVLEGGECCGRWRWVRRAVSARDCSVSNRQEK